MEQKNQEVKPSNVSDNLNNIDGNVDDEEIIVSADEIDENKLRENSGNNKNDEILEEKSVSSTDDETGSLKQKKPKPVEGETLRETALRRQIERKNAIIHDLQNKTRGDIFDEKKIENQQNQSVQEIPKNILEERGYSENEIENAKILISELAPKLGFVKAEEIYKNTANQIFNAFSEQHPEYLGQYDEGDERYNTFKEILFKDYKDIKGRNPREIEKIFNKVHRDVEEILGKAEIQNNKRDESEIMAKKQKINSISHSGGVNSSRAKPNKQIVDTSNKRIIDTSKPFEIEGVMFKGFDEDDFN